MLLFGLAPAVMTSRVEIERVLRSGTRQSASKRSRLGTEGLVAGQGGPPPPLLSAPGLGARNLLHIERGEPPFPPPHPLLRDPAGRAHPFPYPAEQTAP